MRAAAPLTEAQMDNLLHQLGNDLRGTLHDIKGLLELVREGPINGRQGDYIDRCRCGADRLLGLVGDLLELTLAETPEPSSGVFAVENTIVEIGTLMQWMAEARNMHLSWQFEGALPAAVSGDPLLLQDTIRRLIVTALDLARPDWLDAAASQDSGAVELSVGAAIGSLRFRITAPAGPGTAEILAHPHFAAVELRDATRGLNIVRRRLQGSGGTLDASASGGGFLIQATIPFHEAAAPCPGPTAQLGASSSGKALRLLVAEDSDDSFLLLQAYLVKEGHALSRALNGAQAVEMAHRGTFDFIVMDVNMPEMDGYTATRLIREWETATGRIPLPILLLSADEARRQSQIGAQVGCSGYLTKPATKAQILAALKFYSRQKTHQAVLPG
jgi:CheY-like chemotaxis protein